ncbi:hypothetical protein BDN72DRAFT_779056, partial [Pluteus cervinus]
MVRLEGKHGEVEVEAMFDDGAMVNAISQQFYERHQGCLGSLTPLRKRLRMANGNITQPVGQWEGQINIKGVKASDNFEVFQSRDTWDILIGKPMKRKLRAIHDYRDDEIRIGEG